MQQYDLYINAGKPAIGLYVASGAKLPDSPIRRNGSSTELPPRTCSRRA